MELKEPKGISKDFDNHSGYHDMNVKFWLPMLKKKVEEHKKEKSQKK